MQQKSRVVVVGVDFSELGDRAFRQAYELAAVSATSEVHAISVMSPAASNPATGHDPSEPLSSSLFDAGVAELTKHVNALIFKIDGAAQSGVRVYSHFRVDVPLLGISQLASELEADYIVVGTHGRQGLARWLLGSVAEGVVRHAACPVLVVPPAATVTELPKIEPACALCIDARRSTEGRELWCEQHRVHHGRRHTYHQRDRSSEDSSLPLVGR